VRGANRLASNSLLESVVFAHRAVAAALDSSAERHVVASDGSNAAGNDSAPDVAALTDTLRHTMWEHVGLVRDANGLTTAATAVDSIIQNCDGAERLDAVALRAAAVTASLVVAAAAARTESRGAQLRSDYPESEERWLGTWVMHKQRGSHLDRHALATH
jgi:L-aspartate oxidase